MAVDTIGPWTVKINNFEYIFKALTMININSNITEITRINNTSSQHITMKFQNTWLARYPKPSKCIHDDGIEFGYEFHHMSKVNKIQSVATTIKNPQSNAICKKIHQTIENMI